MHISGEIPPDSNQLAALHYIVVCRYVVLSVKNGNQSLKCVGYNFTGSQSVAVHLYLVRRTYVCAYVQSYTKPCGGDLPSIVVVVVVVGFTQTRIISSPWSQDRFQSLCSGRIYNPTTNEQSQLKVVLHVYYKNVNTLHHQL